MRAAVARRYILVALSAADQAGSKCWAVAAPPQQPVDVQRTVQTVAELAKVGFLRFLNGFRVAAWTVWTDILQPRSAVAQCETQQGQHSQQQPFISCYFGRLPL